MLFCLQWNTAGRCKARNMQGEEGLPFQHEIRPCSQLHSCFVDENIIQLIAEIWFFWTIIVVKWNKFFVQNVVVYIAKQKYLLQVLNLFVFKELAKLLSENEGCERFIFWREQRCPRPSLFCPPTSPPLWKLSVLKVPNVNSPVRNNKKWPQVIAAW